MFISIPAERANDVAKTAVPAEHLVSLELE
jgi:hypothetical protein